MFIGRKKELAELEHAYNLDGFKLFVIGGSYGAGKTTLVEEFCKNKNAILFTADKESRRANLVRFSMDILAHYNDSLHEPFIFWDNAFKYIRDMNSRNSEHIIVVLEKIDELVNKDLMFMDMLRKSIENELINSRIFMIVTSSNTKFLKKEFFTENAAFSSWTAGSLMLERFTLTDDVVELLKAHVSKQTDNISNPRMIKVSADDVIIREGGNSNEMYKIISGKAVCYFDYGTDDELVIGTLKEGRTFGEYSLLTGKPGIYTVVAFTDMLLMRISADDFTKYFELNASNSVEVMKNLAGMLDVLKVNIGMLRKE